MRVYNNTGKDLSTVLKRITEYFTIGVKEKLGIDFSFDPQFDVWETNLPVKEIDLGGRYIADPQSLPLGVFIYNPKNIRYFAITSKTEEKIQTPYFSDDQLFNALTHEIIHLLCFRHGAKDEMDTTTVNGVTYSYYKNNNPYALDGNYARTLRNLAQTTVLDSMFRKLLEILKPKTTAPIYKYFSASEVVGLRADLVHKLDLSREDAGVPFILTRTVDSSDVGVEDSAHHTGEAVDIACQYSNIRWKMVNALLKNGFNRIGIYDKHIHADISTEKPQRVIWWGKSK